jgi:calcineurin-like phosphoesterase family protein
MTARYRYGTHAYALSPRWLKYLLSPVKTTAHVLYARHQRTLLPSPPYTLLPLTKLPNPNPITIVLLSDTHCAQPPVPPGDLLIHAGDITKKGFVGHMQPMLDWLNSLPHTHKVLVAGNHDFALDPSLIGPSAPSRGDPTTLDFGEIHYLVSSSVTLRFPKKERELRIYGSPWSIQRAVKPSRKLHNAFQFERGEDKISGMVPKGTDIIISHGPPKFHRDRFGTGDMYLLEELRRVKPLLGVCGHNHSGWGCDLMRWDRYQGIYEDVVSGKRGLMGLVELWRGVDGAGEETRKDGNTERETLLVNASWENNEDKQITTVEI